MGRSQQSNASQQQVSRPKRRATNAHIFRYLQTRNPSKLEENDLKRALEASLEECPDFFWPEDSASCSSSEQSNLTSATSSSSSNSHKAGKCKSRRSSANNINGKTKRRLFKSTRPNSTASSMQTNHLNQYHQNYTHLPNHLAANSNCCPMSSVHNRYKPVAKKNIYTEADFFHEGIMEYIEFQLIKMEESKQVFKGKQKAQVNSAD